MMTAHLIRQVNSFLFVTHCKVYCTDKKENQIVLIYKVIRSESVAKSYMRKGFLIYEEMHKYCISPYMRRPLVICDFATAPL
jgi:hypothetical protein